MPDVSLGRMKKWGGSKAILLPADIARNLSWRVGDRIAIRSSGEKLVLERIPLEKLAILRDGLPTEVNR